MERRRGRGERRETGCIRLVIASRLGPTLDPSFFLGFSPLLLSVLFFLFSVFSLNYIVGFPASRVLLLGEEGTRLRFFPTNQKGPERLRGRV